MKKLTLFLLATFFVSTIHAQNETNDTLSIQNVIDACINLRDAVAVDDSAAIRQASNKMKECNIDFFDSLENMEGEEQSLNGHLVFHPVFADGLAEGKDMYQYADAFREPPVRRGQTPDGSTLTKTCFIKAGKSIKYTFNANSHMELAVVAEAGGLVTMKIHVTNSNGLNENHNDTTDVRKGRPQRKTSFNLPDSPNSKVTLEVLNRANKDISVVIISN